VNNFFDKVMINADDPAIRNNRLKLISKLRELFLGIADISLLQK
jgi:Glycyl-tRNA synthetase, beta subunit|tara:strand:- start:1160 stop:1291 length:132 start_codon:yes stop_codon:yes gene_type:complete